MKIRDVVYSTGLSGYFNKDLLAVKAGARPNGTFLEGKPLTPGYTHIVQAGSIISVMLVLDDGSIAVGECADVIFSGLAGRDPLFVPTEHLPLLEGVVRTRLVGRDVGSFRAHAQEIDAMEIDGKRLHTALRYGLTQALLSATALAGRQTMAEVIAREYGSRLATEPVGILASCHRGDWLQLDRVIMKRAAVLPHTSFTLAKDLGPEGQGLMDYARAIAARIQEVGAPDYRPRIHLDLYGTLGDLFGADLDGLTEYLVRLGKAAQPFELLIESPVIAATRQAQIEALGHLKAGLRARGSKVGLIADEWCNTLEDTRVFAQAQACDYVQIKTPDLGGINNSIEAVLYCKAHGMGCCLGGTANETDLSARITAQIALATGPDFMLSKPGIGADEGLMILTNEMLRTLALVRRRPDGMKRLTFKNGETAMKLTNRIAIAALAAGLLAMGTLPSAQAQTPKRGGTAVLVLGTDPLSLSPDTTNSVPDVGAGCLLHDALVRFGKGFEIVPSLAKSWEISKDGTVYRFDLVDAKWHDGKPVTSEDVKFTLEEISSKYGPRFNTAGKFIEKIDTPTPKHVIIKLKQPFGPFLFSLACEQNAAIMPAHILRGQDILKHPAILTQPVGAGPFRIKEWVRGSHIALERNPDYWRKDKGEPFLDRVMIKIMPDAAARVLALRAGEVDYVWPDYFPLSAVQQFQKDPNFTMREVSYPGSDIIILNTKNPQLAKREVRQALYTAIDRQFIHDKVFIGLGGIPHSAFDTRLWAYNKGIDYLKMYPYDPKKAAQLLDAAGVKAGPDGTRFTIRLLFETAKPEWLPAAQSLQRFWQAVGVKVVLEGAERPVILKRVYSDYDFEATLQTYTTLGDAALGIARTYVTESIKQGTTFNNAAQYSNPEIDKLFDQGRDAPTQAERQKPYNKIQEILARDLPVLNLHQQPQYAVGSARLQGLWQAANQQWWGSVWMK